MNTSVTVLFQYFLYMDHDGIQIGYGTEAAAKKLLRRGERIGRRRFATGKEAEAACIRWREKLLPQFAQHSHSSVLQ